MKAESHGWYVAQAPDIDEAVQNYKVLETTSLDGFLDWLIYLFGKEIGRNKRTVVQYALI